MFRLVALAHGLVLADERTKRKAKDLVALAGNYSRRGCTKFLHPALRALVRPFRSASPKRKEVALLFNISVQKDETNHSGWDVPPDAMAMQAGAAMVCCDSFNLKNVYRYIIFIYRECLQRP